MTEWSSRRQKDWQNGSVSVLDGHLQDFFEISWGGIGNPTVCQPFLDRLHIDVLSHIYIKYQRIVRKTTIFFFVLINWKS